MRAACGLAFLFCFLLHTTLAANQPLWQIGATDHSDTEFALSHGDYKNFLQTFGSPDHAYYIGVSDPKTDWPCVLPGVVDNWAGSRYAPRNFTEWDQMNTLPIGFVLSQASATGQCLFTIHTADTNPKQPPLLRVTVNGSVFEGQLLAGGSDKSIQQSDLSNAQPQTVNIPFPTSLLKVGYNEITLRIRRGSWILFDSLELQTPQGITLAPPSATVIRAISTPNFAVSHSPKTPATLRIELYRHATPGNLQIQIGDESQTVNIPPGLQILDLPAPVGDDIPIKISDLTPSPGTPGEGRGGSLSSLILHPSSFDFSPQPASTPADYIDQFMGTAHSRWMIAPGPWMPNSMVKISPDNQVASWCAGYDYGHEYIDCFSHIHEWTMAGLGMMPTVGALRTHAGLDNTGYSSRIDKASEHAGLGFYDVFLKDPKIKVELTATTRASLQRYTFPASDQARIVIPFLLPNEYAIHIPAAHVHRVSDTEIEGEVQTFLPKIYGCDQHYTLHFVCQFNKPFEEFGAWQGAPGPDAVIPRGSAVPSLGDPQNGKRAGQPETSRANISANITDIDLSGDCGAYVRFKTSANEQIQVRTGISLVSTDNARENLEKELAKPFGWDFQAVVDNQRKTWNEIFNRIQIDTPNAREKVRFYTNFYRALVDRNTFSDVNGQWIDPAGNKQQLTNPDDVMLSSDALWNTFWNLNQVMNLAAPEWSKRWTDSELQLYDKCGWTSKGPAGLKYISVMVAEHEIPLMVAAYQAGIRPLDAEKILKAAVKMQTTLPQDFPGGGKVGNENLAGYLEHNYVPADGPHKGSTSNTMEYAYDDWCVSQLAKTLGHKAIAEQFLKRSENWRNIFDPEIGSIRPKRSDGSWLTPFDPIHTRGFVEGNAWQYTWFVPQNVPGLIDAMGRDRFIDKLNDGFEKSAITRFNTNDAKDFVPMIDQGNEPTMQVSWLFNYAGRPDLTQKWVRAILDEYYGFTPADAYLGDEDQGQMSAWFVMASMGLFQTDGGCRPHPFYEISAPIYPKITIYLSDKYFTGKTFTVQCKNFSPENKFIQSAELNGKPLNQWWIARKQILKGGTLTLTLGPTPNKSWAANSPLPR